MREGDKEKRREREEYREGERECNQGTKKYSNRIKEGSNVYRKDV